MKEIGRDNYELYALDYTEGKLDKAGKKAFEDFLLMHPDIAEEIEGLEEFSVEIEQGSVNFDDLKKGSLLSEDINRENAEVYFVAYHEGDLDSSEKNKVEKFLDHYPKHKNDFIQLGLLRYKADNKITFPLKRKLKKSTPVITLKKALRVAAVFLIIFSLGLYLFKPKEEVYYTSRSGEIEFSKEKDPNLNFEPVKSENISEIARVESIKPAKTNSKKEDLTIENEDVLVEETTLKERTLASIQKDQANDEEAIYGKEESMLATTSELENEDGDVAIESNSLPLEEGVSDIAEEGSSTAIAEETFADENSQTILKFKRPFKKQNKEEELLASNDSETILKVSNPLKGRMRKISFGPLKVKKK